MSIKINITLEIEELASLLRHGLKEENRCSSGLILPTDISDWIARNDNAIEILRTFMKSYENYSMITRKWKIKEGKEWVKFRDQLPESRDFPILEWDKEFNKTHLFSTLSEIGIKPRQSCIKDELYWISIEFD